MEKLSVDEILRRKNYEGIVTGIPTGMYADRESYGNAPILAFILDGRLPCKVRARPYSHLHRTQEGESGINEQKGFLEELIDKITNVEFDDENEKLGVAAAYMDHAIRNKSSIEIHGIYENQLFTVNYLKVENFGFEFPGYKFFFEREGEE